MQTNSNWRNLGLWEENGSVWLNSLRHLSAVSCVESNRVLWAHVFNIPFIIITWSNLLTCPGCSSPSNLFIYCPCPFVFSPHCLCYSECVHCFPALSLCCFAYLIFGFLLALCLLLCAWIVLTCLCMISCFWSRDTAVLNFTLPPLSFSASES